MSERTKEHIAVAIRLFFAAVMFGSLIVGFLSLRGIRMTINI